MLRHPHAACGHDQRRAGRDIERPRAVAACPAGVEHAVVALRQLHGMRTHGAREADDFGWPLALHREANQESGDLSGRRAPVHHLAHRGGRFIGGEILAARQFVD